MCLHFPVTWKTERNTTSIRLIKSLVKQTVAPGSQPSSHYIYPSGSSPEEPNSARGGGLDFSCHLVYQYLQSPQCSCYSASHNVNTCIFNAHCIIDLTLINLNISTLGLKKEKKGDFAAGFLSSGRGAAACGFTSASSVVVLEASAFFNELKEKTILSKKLKPEL